MTTVNQAHHLRRILDEISDMGWGVSDHDGKAKLTPGPRLMHLFDFSDSASFFFHSLEEAHAWARGWSDHQIYLCLRPKPKGKSKTKPGPRLKTKKRSR